MQYELHDTLLIIKSDEGFETTIDAEYLSKIEIDSMLNFLVQNEIVEIDEDGNPMQISNITLPTFDLLPLDYDRDVTSFIQVRKDTNEIIILIQVDHLRYSTSIMNKFPLNSENKNTMIEMLNKLTDIAFFGTLSDIYDHFAVSDSDESDSDSSDSSNSFVSLQ